MSNTNASTNTAELIADTAHSELIVDTAHSDQDDDRELSDSEERICAVPKDPQYPRSTVYCPGKYIL